MSEPFIAEVRIFAGNFAPRSWAFCNGQLLPISNNTALFSLIGTTYGGDGRTTTALPNLQGRAPMHPGRGPGLTPRRLGQAIGINDVTLTEEQIPTHSHSFRVDSGPSTVTPPSAASAVANSRGINAWQSNTTTNLVDMASESIGNSGGGQPHSNEQPFLSLNFIIALQGLYPSRS